MTAETKRWIEMGKGEYGPMKAMMFGRLSFDGPMGEAMGNMGPFEGFLLLVGKVPGETGRLPVTVATVNAPHSPAADQRRYARLLALGTHAGLALLVVLFGLYMLGHRRAARRRTRACRSCGSFPPQQFLETDGHRGRGWGWTALVHRGDILTLVGDRRPSRSARCRACSR